MRNKASGISLLELLCSLAIISVILMLVVGYYSTQNKTQLQISKAAEQIQQLASAGYEWQAAQSKTDFDGISLAVLLDSGLLPTNDYSQKGPWGGGFSVSAANADPQYLSINLYSIPVAACNNLRERLRSVAHNQSSQDDCKQGSYYIIL